MAQQAGWIKIREELIHIETELTAQYSNLNKEAWSKIRKDIETEASTAKDPPDLLLAFRGGQAKDTRQARCDAVQSAVWRTLKVRLV